MKRIYLFYDLHIFYDLNLFTMWLRWLYVVSSAPSFFLVNGELHLVSYLVYVYKRLLLLPFFLVTLYYIMYMYFIFSILMNISYI